MVFHTPAITCILLLVCCNYYAEGVRWHRGEGDAIGSFTVGVGAGAGGFSVSPWPPSLGDALESNRSDGPALESDGPALDSDEDVVCRKKSWGKACKNACAKEGLACDAQMKHPYSPSSGTGKLWKCSGETNKEECKYVYDNGDECTFVRKTNKKYCKYSSGN